MCGFVWIKCHLTKVNHIWYDRCAISIRVIHKCFIYPLWVCQSVPLYCCIIWLWIIQITLANPREVDFIDVFCFPESVSLFLGIVCKPHGEVLAHWVDRVITT